MNPWCVGDSLVYLSSLELMTQESPSSTRRGGSICLLTVSAVSAVNDTSDTVSSDVTGDTISQDYDNEDSTKKNYHQQNSINNE